MAQYDDGISGSETQYPAMQYIYPSDGGFANVYEARPMNYMYGGYPLEGRYMNYPEAYGYGGYPNVMGETRADERIRPFGFPIRPFGFGIPFGIGFGFGAPFGAFPFFLI